MILNCETCEHKIECEKAHGKKREDGDDFRAVCGTHFCLKSWEGLKRNTENNNEQ